MSSPPRDIPTSDLDDVEMDTQVEESMQNAPARGPLFLEGTPSVAGTPSRSAVARRALGMSTPRRQQTPLFAPGASSPNFPLNSTFMANSNPDRGTTSLAGEQVLEPRIVRKVRGVMIMREYGEPYFLAVPDPEGFESWLASQRIYRHAEGTHTGTLTYDPYAASAIQRQCRTGLPEKSHEKEKMRMGHIVPSGPKERAPDLSSVPSHSRVQARSEEKTT